MAQLMLVNPRKRRKSRKSPAKKSVARRAVARVSSAVKSIRKRYRRNPINMGGTANKAITQFKEGAIGAAGALAVDVAMQKLPIPANLKTGTAAPIVKGLVGIGIGMAVAKFGKNKQLGQAMAQGAVTVSLYTAGREMLKKPLGLAGTYDDLGNDFDDLGYYEMGELLGPDEDNGISGDDDFMGAYDNGAVTFN